MKWNTHIVIGISYAAITGKMETTTAILLSAGSVFPDIIDRGISFGIEQLWQKAHRKISHWFILYLTLIILCVYAEYYYPYYFFIGALLHIYADALTVSGVPLFNPFQAGYGLKTAKTGRFSEYIFAGVMIGAMFLLEFIPVPLWISLSVVFVLIAVIGKKNIKDDKRIKQQILLRDLSALWKTDPSHNSETVTDKQKVDPNENTVKQKTLEFSHKQLTDFFRTHVSELPELPLKVITGVMAYLDQYGDCPSVSNKSNDIIPYQNESLDVLRKITLLEHSINTAVIMLKAIRNPGIYAGQLIIAGLAHDLGKVPAADTLNIGDHPRISVMLLNSIEGFRELPYTKEVETAILNHHGKSENDLGEKLFKANADARKYELSQYIANAEDNTSKDIKHIDISTFIHVLSKAVNPANSKRIDLFSFGDKVYVKPNALFKILKAASSGVEEVTSDDDSKKEILRNAVMELSHNGLIDEAIDIKKGYFSSPFVVEMKDGTNHRVYFTVFHLDTLDNPQNIKSRRSGILNEIIAVTPKYGEESQ